MSNNNTISLKFVLKDGNDEPEVRRFTVDRRIGTSLASLQKLLATIHPNLGPFKLSWTDVDGDKVSIGSDNELATALIAMKGPIYKFNVDYAQQKNKTDSGQKELFQQTHFGVTCDGCERPIIGPRFKCRTCMDYDLCKTCEETGLHLFHDMVRIATPNMIDPRMVEHIRYGPFAVNRHSDFCPQQKVLRSEATSQPKPKSFVRIPTTQTTFLGESDKTESHQTERVGKPEDPKMQVIKTPFGKMFYWLGNCSEEDKADKPKEEGKQVEQKPETVQKKSSTPEPEKSKEDLKRGNGGEPKPTKLYEAFKPKGLELKLIDTPFGKMFYWVGSASHEVDQPKEEKSEESYEIKINQLPSKEQPKQDEPPKPDQTNQNETKTDESSSHTPEKSSEASNEKATENPTNSAETRKSENVSVEQNRSTEKDRSIEEALEAMLSMGFNDEGGWLTNLLATKIGKALNDDLHLHSSSPFIAG